LGQKKRGRDSDTQHVIEILMGAGLEAAPGQARIVDEIVDGAILGDYL
jgi:hypothetical protein